MHPSFIAERQIALQVFTYYIEDSAVQSSSNQFSSSTHKLWNNKIFIDCGMIFTHYKLMSSENKSLFDGSV